MRVAIHDAEADHFKTLDKFPNYALMKISAWHKAKGDEVEWFEPILRVGKMLTERGVAPSNLFAYCLITDDLADDLKRIYAMRELGCITIYGMPYKDGRKGIMPKQWQNVMAQKYIYSGQWRSTDWDKWKEQHKYYFKMDGER